MRVSRLPRSIISIVLCSLLLLLGAIAIPSYAEAAAIRLEQKSIVIGTDDGVLFGLVNSPEADRDKNSLFKWKSANKKVLGVESEGDIAVLHGKKVGKTTVSVRYRGKTYKAKVTVRETRLDKASLKMTVGDTRKLKIQNTENAADYKWKSSNESVAMVSGAGKVVALREGKATITASYSALYEWGVSTKLKCTVEVGAAQAPTEPTTPTTPTEPTKPAELLKVSSSNVSVNAGASEDVVVTWEGSTPHDLAAGSGDKSIADIDWVGDGKEYSGGYRSSLRITGVRAGSTTVKVTNKASGDVVLISVRVNYVVTDKATFTLNRDSYGFFTPQSQIKKRIADDYGNVLEVGVEGFAKAGGKMEVSIKCITEGRYSPSSIKWKFKSGSYIYDYGYIHGPSSLSEGESCTEYFYLPNRAFTGSSYSLELYL